MSSDVLSLVWDKTAVEEVREVNTIQLANTTQQLTVTTLGFRAS